MIWARGHRADWDHLAEVTADPEWSYQAVLRTYARIENYHGDIDIPRGADGPVSISQAARDQMSAAVQSAASALGIPSFSNANGLMMEAANGCSLSDTLACGRKRVTVFDAYLHDFPTRKNLTVLANTPARRILVERGEAVGVEAWFEGRPVRFSATTQIVLSAGAINTPSILLKSGIGDIRELRRIGIPATAHLPGVGKNLQDHLYLPTFYERKLPISPIGNGIGATLYASLSHHSGGPDVEISTTTTPLTASAASHANELLPNSLTLLTGLLRPKSRGSVRLNSDHDDEGVSVETNMLCDPEDVRSVRAAAKLTCELASEASLVSPPQGGLSTHAGYRSDLDEYIRRNAITLGHYASSAKMGRDEMAVVDGKMRVYGVDNLMIADASILPRVPTTAPMASCVVIGERAAEIILKRINGHDRPSYRLDEMETRFSW
jgi:choline dehydrogenase